MGKVVGAVLSSAEFSDLRDVPIYLGGPVRQEHLTFASLTWPAEGSGLHYRTHLTTAEAIELQRAGASVRAFLGYAGWTEGQLEEELQAEAWIRRPASPSVLSPRGPAELWRTLLCALGPWGQILAGTPDDLSLN